MAETGIMTHIVAGYPTLPDNRRLIDIMAREGVAYIEIQIPFSDPVADGPTILRANQASLQGGMTVEKCFDLAAEMTGKHEKVNFLFMTYYNIIFRYGVARFMKAARNAGMYGLIVPDIPPEEDTEGFYDSAEKFGLKVVPVVSPTTSRERLTALTEKASGLIYCTSRVGITGTGKSLSSGLKRYVKSIKQITDLPVAVGFGIDSPARASEVGAFADVIVIGSKILKLVDENKNFDSAVSDFLQKTTRAL